MAKNEIFCVEIPVNDPQAMEEFNKAMADLQDALAQQTQDTAAELGVSAGTANAIEYLRTRSRYTPELEQRLIDADKAGTPIDPGDVMSGDWPYDEDPVERAHRLFDPVIDQADDEAAPTRTKRPDETRRFRELMGSIEEIIYIKATSFGYASHQEALRDLEEHILPHMKQTLVVNIGGAVATLDKKS